MLDFTRFEALTFDCYGTLIDWETGIVNALSPIATAHGKQIPAPQILEMYSEIEPAIQSGSYKPYRQILEEVVERFGQQLGFAPTPEQKHSLPESLRNWKPFPDTVEALGRLKTRFKLGIISNIDDDLFAYSAQHLQVPFDWITTAQQAGSYKPSQNNFHVALKKMGLPKEKVLHCAQSLFHDIAVARELGLNSVWVNRKHAVTGFGATKQTPTPVQPDLEVPDLKTLADKAV
jgi:2-haloacid dehalogenase